MKSDEHTKRLAQKYDNMFHFYLAKSINQLLRKKSYSPDVILFQDLQFLDQEYEFLKRYYRREQVASRIQLLTNYFIKCRVLPEETPCLASQNGRKYMFKRIKRYGKYKKRVEQMQNEWDSELPEVYQQYLHSVKTSQLHQSFEIQEKKQTSYDTIAYDIFQQHNEQSNSIPLKFIKNIFTLEQNSQQQFNNSFDQPTNLVFDFTPQQTKKKFFHLDFKKLNHNIEPDMSSKESLTKKHISSLSPKTRYQQTIGPTKRVQYKMKQDNIKEYIRIKKQMYRDPQSQKQLRQTFSNHTYKLKTINDQKQEQPKYNKNNNNIQHQQYIKLLQKVRNKYRSPEPTSHHHYKSKQSLHQYSQIPSKSNRLQTLRNKAMRLIQDTKGIREAKSNDPTFRYK